MSVACVVDGSVVIAWLFDDESNAYADRILDQMESSRFVAPTLLQLELVNAIVSGERRKRFRPESAVPLLHRILQLPIDFDATPPVVRLPMTLALARRHELSAYDGAYLELAIRTGLPLATLDERLRKAAGAEGLPKL